MLFFFAMFFFLDSGWGLTKLMKMHFLGIEDDVTQTQTNKEWFVKKFLGEKGLGTCIIAWIC